jgi:hypothetical protein
MNLNNYLLSKSLSLQPCGVSMGFCEEQILSRWDPEHPLSGIFQRIDTPPTWLRRHSQNGGEFIILEGEPTSAFWMHARPEMRPLIGCILRVTFDLTSFDDLTAVAWEIGSESCDPLSWNFSDPAKRCVLFDACFSGPEIIENQSEVAFELPQSTYAIRTLEGYSESHDGLVVIHEFYLD